MKVWIAGFGNIDREDDGAGIVLALRLADWLGKEHDVSLSLEHQLLPELVYEIDGADMAIFVDADMRRHECGFSIRPISPSPQIEGLNIHSMGPGWLLELAQTMKLSPARALLVSVSGESFNFSNELTPECKIRLDAAEKSFKKYFSDFKVEQ